MSELSVLDATGDTKLIWDRRNQVEVDAAREMFDKLKKKAYLAYTVIGERGDKGTVLNRFDPDAERIIMAPPSIGG
jgi:hypothetical protein